MTEEPDQRPETEGSRPHPEQPDKGTGDQTDGAKRGDYDAEPKRRGEHIHVREGRAQRRAAAGVHELVEAECLVPGQHCHRDSRQEGEMNLNWATDPEDHAPTLFPLPACLGHDEPDEIDDRGNDQDDDRSDEQPRLGNEQHG